MGWEKRHCDLRALSCSAAQLLCLLAANTLSDCGNVPLTLDHLEQPRVEHLFTTQAKHLTAKKVTSYCLLMIVSRY